MATNLPMMGQLQARSEWSGRVHKQVMRFANTSVSGTIGFNPRTETVRLTWHLSPDQVTAWLATFQPTFNKRYLFDAGVRGWVILRPTDEYTFADYEFVTEATMSFERVG